MQRIRKISNLFKKPDEPTPDNFLDVTVSRKEKDWEKAQNLKHAKSVPVRRNKPTYRGGQHVPKDKIVYPLIPTSHHVDTLGSRPSTSSYDTFNSEPPLALLPPPSLKAQQYAKEVFAFQKAEREHQARNKPLPASPRRLVKPQYATTHATGYTRPAATRATPAAATAKATPSLVKASAHKEVPKPVPGVNLLLKQTTATSQRTVNYEKLGPPTAKFTMFKPVDKQEAPAAVQSQTPAQAQSTPAQTTAASAKPARRCVFDHDSDDSLSVYSDQFTVDSVSVLTNEERPKIPYVRYHTARTGDEDMRRDPNQVPGEVGPKQDIARGASGRSRCDGDYSFVTSPASLRRQLAVRRTGSNGSLVYQSESLKGADGKSSHAQDVLHRAHKAAAVAGLRATPATAESGPAAAGSGHTKVRMVPANDQAPNPAKGAYHATIAHFQSRPLEAGIPFPSAALRDKPPVTSSAPKPHPRPYQKPSTKANDARSGQVSQEPKRQYYDPLYFNAKQEKAGLQTRTRVAGPSTASHTHSAVHSTPAQATSRARAPSPKLRDVTFPIPQVNVRPLNPYKQSPGTSQTRTAHAPPALQQSLAKHSVKVNQATNGAGKRKSCKAEVGVVYARDGALTDEEELDLALSEPECVTPSPVVDAAGRQTRRPVGARPQPIVSGSKPCARGERSNKK